MSPARTMLCDTIAVATGVLAWVGLLREVSHGCRQGAAARAERSGCFSGKALFPCTCARRRWWPIGGTSTGRLRVG